MSCWLITGILASLMVLAAAVISLVAFFKRRYQTAIRFAVLTASLIVLSIASFGIVAGKIATKVYTKATSVVNNEQQAIQRRQHQIERLKAMTPPTLLAKAPSNFFTYDGYRDWWRIPLIYPYSLQAIDSLDQGATLYRHKGGAIEDPNTSADYLPYSITRYTFDNLWLLFECEGGKEWRLLSFSTSQCQLFDSEQALLTNAKQNGFTGNNHLQSIREGYDRYYFPD